MMRLFTILLTIAFIVASCNRKQVSVIDSKSSVENESIDSLELFHIKAVAWPRENLDPHNYLAS